MAATHGRSARHARARPTAAADAIVAWLLGNDQSPTSGHRAMIASTGSARHGRSASTKVFSSSLTTYATTVDAGASRAAAVASESLRPRARHHVSTNSAPNSSRPTSVYQEKIPRTHAGAAP